jgi:formamidopyrimidine-DNA glycosylase
MDWKRATKRWGLGFFSSAQKGSQATKRPAKVAHDPVATRNTPISLAQVCRKSAQATKRALEDLVLVEAGGED